jgi:hypothetical protein
MCRSTIGITIHDKILEKNQVNKIIELELTIKPKPNNISKNPIVPGCRLYL